MTIDCSCLGVIGKCTHAQRVALHHFAQEPVNTHIPTAPLSAGHTHPTAFTKVPMNCLGHVRGERQALCKSSSCNGALAPSLKPVHSTRFVYRPLVAGMHSQVHQGRSVMLSHRLQAPTAQLCTASSSLTAQPNSFQHSGFRSTADKASKQQTRPQRDR